MPRKVTSTTYLREIPYSKLLELCSQLDIPNVLNKNWKGVASRIKRKNGNDRYNLFNINVFEMETQKGKSPTMAMIGDWGHSNATVQDIVNILDDMEMYAVIQTLLPDWETPEEEKPPEKGKELEEQTITYAEYTSFNPHVSLKDGASLSLPHSTQDGASGSWANPENEVSSTTDGKQPIECDIEAVESSILPHIPLPNEPVCEYKYRDLKEMTDVFNDLPLTKGGCKIGEGGFGAVYRGVFAENQFCAIKRLKKEVLSDDKMAKQFTVEHTTLAKLLHPNLLRLYGYSFDGDFYCLVFEYLVNGSLNDRLACMNGTETLQWTTRVSIAQGAAQGISFLHQNGHVHRDIKSANILLDENNVAKIGDFGLVRHMPTASDKTSFMTSMIVGCSPYMAPEAQYGKISPKIDAYSFGVVLLELMTGWPVVNDEWENPDIVTHVSYEIEEENTDFIKLMDKKLDHNFGEEAVRKMHDITTRLLSHTAKKRPLISEILTDLMQL